MKITKRQEYIIKNMAELRGTDVETFLDVVLAGAIEVSTPRRFDESLLSEPAKELLQDYRIVRDRIHKEIAEYGRETIDGYLKSK